MGRDHRETTTTEELYTVAFDTGARAYRTTIAEALDVALHHWECYGNPTTIECRRTTTRTEEFTAAEFHGEKPKILATARADL